jgi:transcriptional regulator GlxA family with amidase domain
MLQAGRMGERQVVIVGFEGLQTLDAAGPFEVFAGATTAANAEGRHGYRVDLVSSVGGVLRAESGMGLSSAPLPAHRRPIDTLVLAGGHGVGAARHDEALVSWIRTAAPRCRRVATVCSGALLAAEAGLLDGRRVTTHWARADQLAAEYPDVTVDPDPIYVRDGNVWTSAGVTAGIDLALALVEEDLGTELARTVARWLVMFLHRPGGQTQFASPVWVPRAERSPVRSVQERVEASPGADHRLATLASGASMSVRHFTRVFTDQVGETPGRFVERVRVEAARLRLETTDDTLDTVAAECGFGTAETLRRVFHRRLGVAPDAYRRRFRDVAGRSA